MTKFASQALTVLTAALLALPSARAQLTRSDRARLEESIPQTVYLRIDLPCVYGKVGLMASWVQPMVYVSPTGVSTSLDEGWTGGPIGPKRHMLWGFGPNDPLKRTRLLVGTDGTVTLYFLGLEPRVLQRNLPAAIDIVACKTPADFQAAFDRAFSKTPLQDEHPDWSDAVRKAIAGRVLLAGMSREQVRCVTGTPIDIEDGEEGGAKTETWHIRQEKGVWAGVLQNRKIKSGAVSRVTFADGKVIKIDSDPARKK